MKTSDRSSTPIHAEVRHAEHRRDDGGEHHLEDGEVVQVELRHELLRAAEARALEEEAEADADEEGEDEADLVAEHAVLEEWCVHGGILLAYRLPPTAYRLPPAGSHATAT